MPGGWCPEKRIRRTDPKKTTGKPRREKLKKFKLK